MVLSHAKVKRKHREEVAACESSRMEADDGVVPPAEPSTEEGKLGGRHSKKKRKKKDASKVEQSTLTEEAKVKVVDVQQSLNAEEAEGTQEQEVLVGKKNKRKKERWPIHPSLTSNADGNLGVNELSGVTHEMLKYRKAKKLRRIQMEVLQNGIEKSICSAADGDEQNVDVDNSIQFSVPTDAAEVKSEEGQVGEPKGYDNLTVRQRKGKKQKKKGLDRWGEKVREEDDKSNDGCGEDEHSNLKQLTSVDAKKGSSEVSSYIDQLVNIPEHRSSEEYDLKKVFVGGMPYHTTEDDIHDYFAECGAITELDCMTFPDTGNFRGIAFITFKAETGAQAALELDGMDMSGRFLKIEKCKLKRREVSDEKQGSVPKTQGCTSAYIGNLTWDITEENISKFFRKAYKDTKINAIRLAYDKLTGEFRGFGHVDFEDDESLEAAVKLDQKDLFGRPLKISYAVPKRVSLADVQNQSQGKKVRKCYTCGEEGHMAFHCTQKSVAS